MKSDNLQIQYLSLDDIKPYKNNPKKHTEKQVTQIINSIKEFKFNNPILIDENNIIIAGHGRYLAGKHLKLDTVPVIRLTHLNEAQKKAYRIADNKLTENGEWDFDLLKIEFADIENLDLDGGLQLTGFDTAEIDTILTPSMENNNSADPELNNVPFIPDNEIISKPGDIWKLGKHRIICGNALEEETYKNLLGDTLADMIFTDPPYNVKISGHVSVRENNKHKEFAMASGEMSDKQFTNFLTQNFTLLKKFSKEGSLHFICMDWRHIEEICHAGYVFDSFKNVCVWNKTNAGMGSLYRSKYELVFIFKNGKQSHVNNVKLGAEGRYRTNVWDYAGVNGFGKNKKLLKLHPTVKPVEMIWDAILDVSNRGDIVLDSFLGSGSTLIACEKAHRVCFGVELEPIYIDTAIRRWETLTGENATRQQDGKKYKDLLAARQGYNSK